MLVTIGIFLVCPIKPLTLAFTKDRRTERGKRGDYKAWIIQIKQKKSRKKREPRCGYVI